MTDLAEGLAAQRPWPQYLAVMCALVMATPAKAQNRGVYPLGMSAINSGVTPESGFSYANQLLFYVRDEAKDNEGGILPATGLNTVVMDLNIFSWVSSIRVLGARYAVSATLPFAKNSLTSDLQGQISGGLGFADSYFVPLILGWNTGSVDVKAMYGFLAPTGHFTAGADNNVGSGYWTNALSSGQTWYLTPDRAWVFSAFEMYEFHTTQEGTDTHPGQTLDLDYSFLGSVYRSTSVIFQAGLAGYEARQTTATTGPGITAEASADRYAINSLGVALAAAFPKQKASLALRFFQEFADRSTYQGYSVQLSGATKL